MVDYPSTFAQLGAHLRISRKTLALLDHSHLSDVSSYSKRLLTAAYSTSVNDEDIAQAAGKTHLEDVVTTALRTIVDGQKSNFETVFQPVVDNELATSQEDKNAGMIQYTYDSALTNGQVAIAERLGRLGALRRAMIADGQTVLQNVVTFGALVAAVNNVGSLSLGSIVGVDHMFSGILTLEVEDQTVDAPLIRISHQLTDELANGDKQVTADNFLTVGQSYQDGPIGLSALSLALGAIVKTGDDGAILSSPVMTNLREADSDRGKIYIRITRQAVAPIWLVEWFKDGSLSTLIASDNTLGATVGSATITLTGGGGMVFTVTFDMAAAHAFIGAPPGSTDSDITFDPKVPREGDRWTIAVTNSLAGNFSTKLGKLYRASLNTGGAPTISEALASSVSMI